MLSCAERTDGSAESMSVAYTILADYYFMVYDSDSVSGLGLSCTFCFIHSVSRRSHLSLRACQQYNAASDVTSVWECR